MHFKLLSVIALASMALAKPQDVKSVLGDIASDFGDLGTAIEGDVKTVWDEVESHLPTFHYPTSVIHAIETDVKNIPDEVRSKVSEGEDIGKAAFDYAKSDILKHTTIPGWIQSLPSEARNAFSTDLARFESAAGHVKSEATLTSTGTAAAAAASKTSSDNAAAQPTHLGMGAAGVFGILGLAAAL